ncbi:uncharacterized protein LY89DRAFT_707728 [Mollisia scopiformis]|uniref:Membrane-associated proteins in eicosanoid and glutathione metabolism n=1 Tax=Mollisia scopiformis TaxID=149040 RepID=A0A194X9R8_MOLSC|nr:uncharacterized protein LY89DRAFT_707728 [Mollisia scopiformis]KUJ16517.1 hypothetical protein LY89DRAFT_707728 [Mollisia scopiformis]
MASGLFDTTKNYSLYAVPAAWLCAFIPHAYAAFSSKSFDNRSPRTYSESLAKDQTLDQAKKNCILRAESAQMNGFENLPLFTTALLAGNLASLPSSTLNTFAAAYLASRVLYNFIYINNTTETMANVRSLVFISGVGMCMSMFVMSGNALKSGMQNLL